MFGVQALIIISDTLSIQFWTYSLEFCLFSDVKRFCFSLQSIFVERVNPLSKVNTWDIFGDAWTIRTRRQRHERTSEDFALLWGCVRSTNVAHYCDLRVDLFLKLYFHPRNDLCLWQARRRVKSWKNIRKGMMWFGVLGCKLAFWGCKLRNWVSKLRILRLRFKFCGYKRRHFVRRSWR